MNFLLGLLSIVIAIGCLTGTVLLFRLHDYKAEQILIRKQAETIEKMRMLDNDVKDAMERLGFNITILPKEQDLGDWYADSYAAKTMPEEYLLKLKESTIVSVEHLAGRLRQKVKWPETKWTVILVGVGDEIIKQNKDAANSTIETIPRGEIVFGYEIHQGLGFESGETIKLFDRQFVVHKCKSEQGTEDDITAWINLKDAQQLLNKEGLINEIVAMECRSSWFDKRKIREEITQILPGTQVVEKSSDVLAKMHARNKVAEESKAAIEREQENMVSLRAARARFALLFIPLVLVICIIWIGLLAMSNVQSRMTEIGILQTLGFTRGKILVVLLYKFILMGLAGGVLGFLIGGGGVGFFVINPDHNIGIDYWGLDLPLLVLSLFVAVIAAVLAGGFGVVVAGSRDPVTILQQL